MKCDVCQQKEASIFLTQIAEGKMHKVNLCDSCAQAKGVTNPTGFGLTEMLGDASVAGTVVKRTTSPTERTCPDCGFSQSDFKKTGRFGCSTCYQVFSDGLDALLEAMHKHTRHRGKVPARLASSKNMQERLNELEEGLQACIGSQNFEKAAWYRDQIARLKEDTPVAPAAQAMSQEGAEEP